MAGECATTTGEVYTGADLVPLLHRLQTRGWDHAEVEREVMDWVQCVIDPSDGKRYELRFPDPYAAIIDCPPVLPSFHRLGNTGWESSPLVSFQEKPMGSGFAWHGWTYRYAIYPQADRSRFVYTAAGDLHVVALNPWGNVAHDMDSHSQVEFRDRLERLIAS